MNLMMPRPMTAVFFAVVAIGAQAQPIQQDKRVAGCEKEVRDYLSAMQFIRSTAGTNVGDRVAAGVAGENQVQEIVRQQGACVAAQLIRERTAKR
ncbi:hypothetical protein [Caenimonas sp. SL110]|uniref:hypothetical protein n=1 Tax=Caenimonas sp. SL110 TaxID=1450524 RepID=UPI00128CFBDD|nr:hypothetical protein [Caenimonas sp. SL110]